LRFGARRVEERRIAQDHGEELKIGEPVLLRPEDRSGAALEEATASPGAR